MQNVHLIGLSGGGISVDGGGVDLVVVLVCCGMSSRRDVREVTGAEAVVIGICKAVVGFFIR